MPALIYVAYHMHYLLFSSKSHTIELPDKSVAWVCRSNAKLYQNRIIRTTICIHIHLPLFLFAVSSSFSSSISYEDNGQMEGIKKKSQLYQPWSFPNYSLSPSSWPDRGWSFIGRCLIVWAWRVLHQQLDKLVFPSTCSLAKKEGTKEESWLRARAHEHTNKRCCHFKYRTGRKVKAISM